jgi:hypothetical protein
VRISVLYWIENAESAGRLGFSPDRVIVAAVDDGGVVGWDRREHGRR